MSADLLVSPQGARFAGRSLACTIGRGGIGQKRAEGDGITPIGRFALREVWFRADRLNVESTLPLHPITPNDGWSDDPADARYNHPVRLPHSFSHELLFRDGPEYDVLAVVDYNIAPTVPGAGSAIFLHVWKGPGQPTAGCVAFARDDLLEILAAWRPDSRLIIQP